MEYLKNKKILLIISGGIAAYKSLELIRLLKTHDAQVTAILTKAGAQFITPLSVSSLTGQKTYTELWDLTDETEMGHIRLSREHDLILIAPATANIMAKIAHGLADDLATTTLLASNKPIVVAPAMNPEMWENPATQTNALILQGRDITFSGPEKGEMACGEIGYGRFREPQDILNDINFFFANQINSIEKNVANDRPLLGKKVIVTSGPTHEAIDPVRFIGNHSSGKQGHAIACSLRDAGADVTYITGPTSLEPPQNIKTIKVTSANEMLEQVMENMPADIFIGAAAVADWQLANKSSQKLKKEDGQNKLELKFERTPDILNTIGHLPENQRPKMVIGFAAETEHLIENAKKKLQDKAADLILANPVHKDDCVFGSDHNHVYAITQADVKEWTKTSKSEIASHLCDLIFKYFEHYKNSSEAA